MQNKLTDVERQRIRIALVEDGGKGDVTSIATIPQGLLGEGRFVVKAPGILAGIDVARYAFILYEVQNGIVAPLFEFNELKNDGDQVNAGEVVATIRAPMTTLLAAERVGLNFLQRMSGIATLTAKFVKQVAGTGAIILDTRKTAPLLRPFDRFAVRAGGGSNHRSSLSEMILIKDNHLAANNGDVLKVVEAIEKYFSDEKIEKVPVEIEVTNLEQFQIILEHGRTVVQRVMFDNFPVRLLREGVVLNNGLFEIEASGGITLDTVRAVAETGVNFISVGALTHSVAGLDISLEIEPLSSSADSDA